MALAAKVKFLEYDRLHGNEGSFRKIPNFDVGLRRPVTRLVYSFPTWDNLIKEIDVCTYEHYNFTHFAERKFKYTRLVSLRTESGTILHFSVNTEHGTVVRVEAEELLTLCDWKRIEDDE